MSLHSILLKGGWVIDPVNGIDGEADILLEDGHVTQLGPELKVRPGTPVVEVPQGCVLCPGFIDMRVHLSEPGYEHKETVSTGLAAAAAGGFTAVASMPNTEPVNDDAGITGLVLARAAEAELVRVHPVGAVTRGLAGERLAELGELREAGCVAVSNGVRSVADANLMRRVLEYASMCGMAVIDHCEDVLLTQDGVANDGFQAAALGLRGMPSAAEDIFVERDVTLSGMTGAPLHIAHLSTRGALEAVRSGKARDFPVSCEVTPHHLTLTDDRLDGYDTNYKVNPPLREQQDVEALLQGLQDGTIDCIASDHEPHHYDEKLVEFDRAPFGIAGLETVVSICLDRLIHPGYLSLTRLVELLAINPARILGVVGGSLGVGSPADITVLAPDLPVTVNAGEFRSLARNTPFDGWALRGGVAASIVGGRTVYANSSVDGAVEFETVTSDQQ